MNIKERIRLIIDHICNADIGEYEILASLRAILAALEASELRKCPKCGNEDEPLQACDHCGHTWYTTSKLDRGIEAAEPPKPTGEQLKAIGKVLDGDAPREYTAGDRIWTEFGVSRVLEGSETGRCRWHLKDAPTLTKLRGANIQATSDHDGGAFARCSYCQRYSDYPGVLRGRTLCDCGEALGWSGSFKRPTSDSIWCKSTCVPWVEPVKALMSTCEGCHKEFGDGDCFEECTGYTDSAAFRTMPRHNYTPKEPEPVVKKNFTAVEPEAEPGLVWYKVKKTDDWWVYLLLTDCNEVLGNAFSKPDFHHIELKSGATVTVLSAFDANDPPVRAWFRE